MTNQPLNLKDLKAQLQQHLQHTDDSLRDGDLQLLAHGEANVIYRLNRDRLIRVAVNTPNQRFAGNPKRLSQFEHSVLQYLQGSGIGHRLQGAELDPVGFPYSYLITNYLEGDALDYSRTHLQQCAQTLARLHRLPLSAEYRLDRLAAVPVCDRPLTLFYQESQAYAQPYLDSPQADPEIVAMLKAVLKQAQRRLDREDWLMQFPHVCLVHSDHTCENWVINDRQAFLIDWEWAELSSAAGDLGHFLSPITIIRRQGYQMPAADRAFFLECYYDALEDAALAKTIQQHFAAFGAFPAVRSLCWTAGYWVTAALWYADATEDSPSAALRLARFQQSQQQFPALWQEVMNWLADEMPI